MAKQKPRKKDVSNFRPRKRNVISRVRSDGVVIVVNLSCDEHFFQLDRVAAEFWSLIDGKRSVAAICAILARKHKAAESRIRAEATKLIGDLTRHSLIE